MLANKTYQVSIFILLTITMINQLIAEEASDQDQTKLLNVEVRKKLF